MTAAGRRAATAPGNFKMTMRSMDQAEKPGARINHINLVKRTAAATGYRAKYVDTPTHIADLEQHLANTRHGVWRPIRCSTNGEGRARAPLGVRAPPSGGRGVWIAR